MIQLYDDQLKVQTTKKLGAAAGSVIAVMKAKFINDLFRRNPEVCLSVNCSDFFSNLSEFFQTLPQLRICSCTR